VHDRSTTSSRSLLPVSPHKPDPLANGRLPSLPFGSSPCRRLYSSRERYELQAADILRRARRLSIGADRNDLYQLAT